MSNFTAISAAIVNVLQGVQQGGAAAFQYIATNPSTNFTGTPAVTVVPGDSESQYQTVTSNLRSYIFYLDIYLDVQADGSGMTIAFPQMLILVDSTLDALDNSNSLGIGSIAQIVTPTPSAWALMESADSVLLTARILLTVKSSTSTNNG